MKREKRLALINARNAPINSHNTAQSENSENDQWRVVGGKKEAEIASTRKQLKIDYCWQEKPIPIYNTFEGLEEPEDVNNNIEPVREAKSPPIFISKVSDPLLLRQLLNQITNGEFDLKNINPYNYKIQPKSSITYTNIVKELKIRNTEFHTSKPKQEKASK